MKKTFLFAALAALSMLSCTNNELPEAELGYGYINLNVSNDVAVTTRTGTPTEVSTEELANWTAVVMKGSTNSYSGIASDLSKKSFIAGSDYSLKVYNYASDEDAHAQTVNEGWGAARYCGDYVNNTNQTTTFSITKGNTTSLTVDCGRAKNNRLAVVFNESFTGVATNYKIVTTCSGRTHTFENNSTGTNTLSKKAYYSVNSTVEYTLSYNFNGQDKEVKGRITTNAEGGYEHVLNVGLNSNGSVSLSISYTDFTQAPNTDIVIDGGTGNEASDGEE